MEEFHIPWSVEALETLLRELVPRGEATKVDLKRELSLSSEQGKVELAKDIAAIANSYDTNYKNHGFIVLGATGGTIVGTTFASDQDQLQASIDQVVRHYIGPFVPTYLYFFGEADCRWGVIVIPPSGGAPHVFIKDGHKRHQGEVYVRVGTTTSLAAPSDYARFFRTHYLLESHELRQQVQDLARQVATLQKTRRVKPRSSAAPPETTMTASTPADLLSLIGKALERETDPIAEGLFQEVDKILALINSDRIRWNFKASTQAESEEVLGLLEQTSDAYWRALAAVVERDRDGRYDEVVAQSLEQLAQEPAVPTGVPYNDLSVGIRYYPLVTALQIVFALGSARRADQLLRRVAQLRLKSRDQYADDIPIGVVLFYLRRAANVFQARNPNFPQQRWCDAAASVIRTTFERIVVPRNRALKLGQAFFEGEFMLSLVPAQSSELGYPSSGLYLFLHEARPAITRFLKMERSWAEKVFVRPFRELLQKFDEEAPKMARSGGCWGSGFDSGAVASAYPELSPTQG